MYTLVMAFVSQGAASSVATFMQDPLKPVCCLTTCHVIMSTVAIFKHFACRFCGVRWDALRALLFIREHLHNNNRGNEQFVEGQHTSDLQLSQSAI